MGFEQLCRLPKRMTTQRGLHAALAAALSTQHTGADLVDAAKSRSFVRESMAVRPRRVCRARFGLLLQFEAFVSRDLP